MGLGKALRGHVEKTSILFKKSSPVTKMSRSPLHQDLSDYEMTLQDDALEFAEQYKKKKEVKTNIGKKKLKKKAAKSLGGKILSKFIPFVGQAMLAHDIYSIGKRVKKGEGLWSATKGHYLGQE